MKRFTISFRFIIKRSEQGSSKLVLITTCNYQRLQIITNNQWLGLGHSTAFYKYCAHVMFWNLFITQVYLRTLTFIRKLAIASTGQGMISNLYSDMNCGVNGCRTLGSWGMIGGTSESGVWRKGIAWVRVGEVSHHQNKFRILSADRILNLFYM